MICGRYNWFTLHLTYSSSLSSKFSHYTACTFSKIVPSGAIIWSGSQGNEYSVTNSAIDKCSTFTFHC